MGYKPPSPIIIEGGGGSSGGSISNPDSEVSVKTDGDGNSYLYFKTADEEAMRIDSSQLITMGNSTTASSTKLRVIDSFGRCLSLINSLSLDTANFQIDTNGLTITSSNGNIKIGSNKLYIQNGNFYLSDAQVSATAGQLNYTIATPGSATALKALVIDADKSISGITTLTSDSLYGTLMTGVQPNITTLGTINITSGLSLLGTAVNSTATELNYLHAITQGTAVANKAFVFDTNRNMLGVNRITTSTIAGTLETSSQPNITTVGTLSNINTSGSVGIGTTTPSTQLEIKGGTPTITLNNNTTTAQVSLAGNNLNLISNNEIVLSGNTRLLNNTLSGITTLTAAILSGVISTANQPAITQVGSLLSLDVLGDVSIGQLTTNASTYRLLLKEQSGNLLQLQRSALLNCSFVINSSGDLIITPTRNVVLTSALTIAGSLDGITSLSATTLTGTLQTASQPNITTVGTLNNLSVINNISASGVSATTLTGTLQTAAQPNITSVGTLSSLAVSTSISASSLTASTLTGTLQTALQPNITRTGTLTQLLTTAPLGINVSSPTSVIDVNADGLTQALAIAMTDGTNSSTISTDSTGIVLNMSGGLLTLGLNKSLKFNGGGIIGLDSLSVNTLTGTLQTAAQPNITSIGTLSSLAVTNGITGSSVSATTLTGTLQTASQPNITTVGTLNNLSVINNISASGVSATTLTGTLQTALQPNITRTGTLTQLLTTAPLGINVSSPTSVIDINTDGLTQALAIAMTDGTNSSTISTGVSGITLDTSGDYISLGSNKSLKLNGGTIVGLTSLDATSITGTLQTADQPNITSVGTLDYVDTTYIGLGTPHSSDYRINILDNTGKYISCDSGTKTLTLSIISDDYTINTSNQRLALHTNVNLVMNGGTIIGLSSLNIPSITGTLQTAAQPNITSVGTLSGLTVSSSASFAGFTSSAQISAPSMQITAGPLTILGDASVYNITMGTSFTLGTTTMDQQALDDLIIAANRPGLAAGAPGVVEAEKALIPDINKDLGTFRNLYATTLYGVINDSYQSNITTVGTLNYLNTSGSIGVGTVTPAQQVEIVSATGNCLRLTNDGVSKQADLLVDDSGNLIITPSTTVKTNTMMIGNATANQIPMEVGYAAFTMTNPYAYRTSSGATGIVDPVVAPTSYNYSIRALGRILCTGSIDVMSDRRVKTNIRELTDEYCTSFIKCTTPVQYNRKDNDDNEYFGYIAQELIRSGFEDLVNFIPDDNMVEEVDEDGYVSPEGMAYNISYEHIIPILAKNQKRLMQENEELKSKIDIIMKMLEDQSK